MSEFEASSEISNEMDAPEGLAAAPTGSFDFDRSEVEIKDIKLALAYKEEGNDLYRSQDYDGSVEKYSLAILHCPNDDVESKAIFLGNRAAAYYSIEEYRQVVDDCTAALELKPDYVKVLHRRAQVYNHIGLVSGSLARSPSQSPFRSLTHSLTHSLKGT